jgi:UDP-N-acetylglucosamine/UDP-N-acetylgalactosamine 4-epimerase
MNQYQRVQQQLRRSPQKFLVTGAAGFIGSHLVEKLLALGHRVVGLDDFSTGNRANLADVLARRPKLEVPPEFRFIEGDIRDRRTCLEAARGVDVVLHQAALASVPRSMADPLRTHSVNVDGFVKVVLAAHACGVRRVVYASSSSVYGDDDTQPQTEEKIGRPLSPYATTKLVDEIYANTFRRTHRIDCIGLRYFNVFGPRQDPEGAYAAVIPRWAQSLFDEEACVAFGDGTASRDFCFIDNVVQANLLAACTSPVEHEVFNVACGKKTTLRELFTAIRNSVMQHEPSAQRSELGFAPPRPGDIPHSLACIDRARQALGYEPSHGVAQGMDETIAWYALNATRKRQAGNGTSHAMYASKVS